MWTEDNKYLITGDPKTKELDLYHVVVAPSFACNLRCKHCYLPDHNARMIPWDSIRNLLHQFSNTVLNERGRWGGVFHVKGGEATVLPYFQDLVEEIYNLQSVRFLVTTNGLKLDQQLLDVFGSMTESMSQSLIVTVSIDGDKEAHDAVRGKGTYEKAWKSIGHCIDRGIPVHVNTVLSKDSASNVRSVLAMALNHGVTQVNILPFIREGYGEQMSASWMSPEERFEWLEQFFLSLESSERDLLYGSIPSLLRSTKESLSECVVGYRGLSYVLPSGATYSCPSLVHSDYVIGNVFEESFETIHDRLANKLIYDAVPKVCGASCDTSCRGAVVGEATRGNQLIHIDEATVSEKAGQIDSGMGEPIAACFSRNI